MTASRDLSRLVKNIRTSVKKLNDKKTMRALGTEASRIVKKRTRRGFGVRKTGGNQYRFPSLSVAYIERRKKKRLSKFTSARKSNVTFTGRLLQSVKATTVRKGFVEIGASRVRPGGLKNETLVEYLADMDREFLNLSKGEIVKLRRFYRRRLLKL